MCVHFRYYTRGWKERRPLEILCIRCPQTMDEVETKCVFEEKIRISRLYRVAVGSQYPVRFFPFALC
jgi:hypothetical protein